MAIYSWFSHWKWWFPIAMLVYQRVCFCFTHIFFHSLMRKNHRFFWLYLPQFPAGAFRRRIHLRPHRFRTTTARQLGEHVGKMLENMLNWNQHKSASFLQLVAIIDNVLTKAGTIVGLDEREGLHMFVDAHEPFWFWSRSFFWREWVFQFAINDHRRTNYRFPIQTYRILMLINKLIAKWCP